MEAGKRVSRLSAFALSLTLPSRLAPAGIGCGALAEAARVWDSETGYCLVEMAFDGVSSATLAADGVAALTGDKRGSVNFFVLGHRWGTSHIV